MMVDMLMAEYGFSLNADGLYVKQTGKTVYLIVECFDCEEAGFVYDFYKLSTYKKGCTKYVERQVSDVFLMASIKKYFKQLKNWEKKKILEPFGGSEDAYCQRLWLLEKRRREREAKEEAISVGMREANVSRVSKERSRVGRNRWVGDDQLRLNFD